MKPYCYYAAGCLLTLAIAPAFAQSPPPPPPGYSTLTLNAETKPEPPPLTKFNLDFPGGNPAQLVQAIEKATGRPLNVVIPATEADVHLPALKMNNVVVPDLFSALRSSGYVFETSSAKSPTDNSVWHFYTGNHSNKVSRFYALAPYLDRGLSVDDITTAITTAWKMMGEDSLPQISFHKETKLLIAVGDPRKLETIDAALKALDVPPKASDGPKRSKITL